MKHTEIPTQMTKEKLGENPLLEPGDKMVYAAIRRYMNADNRECFPSYTTICGTLKTGRTKVANAIDRLVAAGFLQKNQSGTGKYVKNSYYFPITEFDKKFERKRLVRKEMEYLYCKNDFNSIYLHRKLCLY